MCNKILVQKILSVFIIVVVLSMSAASARPAQAAGVLANCDQASLIAAIGTGGTVTFACNGTITLTAPIEITGDSVIDGLNHKVTISGGNSTRLFIVDVTGAKLTLKKPDAGPGQGDGA